MNRRGFFSALFSGIAAAIAAKLGFGRNGSALEVEGYGVAIPYVLSASRWVNHPIVDETMLKVAMQGHPEWCPTCSTLGTKERGHATTCPIPALDASLKPFEAIQKPAVVISGAPTQDS